LLVVPPYFDEVRLGELYGDLSDFRVVHDAHEALYSSDFAFVCSGTATLEAALIGIPFVLAYRGKALDIFLARTLTDLEYAGLANIFSLDFQGRPMHPELIQEELSTESLLQAYEEFDRERYFADVLKLRRYLGTGSSRRVAEILTS
jgi:lipid-A-disaccharide synthase